MDKNGEPNQNPSVVQQPKRQEKYPNLLAGNPNGRPTKYRDEFVGEVDKYIDYCLNWNKDHGYKTLVGVEGFAVWLGVDDTTVLSWANKRLKDDKGNVTRKLARPDFFAAIKKLKNFQKTQLITDGFYGGREVNATMAIFLLKVNHNMVETQHVDHTTKGKEMPTPILGGGSNVPVNNSDK